MHSRLSLPGKVQKIFEKFAKSPEAEALIAKRLPISGDETQELPSDCQAAIAKPLFDQDLARFGKKLALSHYFLIFQQ